MSFPKYGSSVSQRPLSLRSRTLFHFNAAYRSLDSLAGQIGSLARSTSATATDSFGNTYTAVGVQPRWESRDTNSDSIRDALGLFMDTADKLSWPCNLGVYGMAGRIEFIQTTTMAAAGSALFYLGNDAVSGARLFIASSGTGYQIAHHNGTSQVTSTALSSAPSAGNLVVLRWQFSATGAVQLWQSINGGAETTQGATGTLTPAAAWGTTTKIRLNSLGSGTAMQAWYRSAKVVYGTPTSAFLASIL